MIAIEVRLNGKCVCIAGADDLAVLSAHVTAVGKLGKKTVPARPDNTTSTIGLSVGGLTGRQDPKKDVHLKWMNNPHLQAGDIIQFKILETEKVDRATSRIRDKNRAKMKRA
jgi:hypothetical protein